MKFKIDLQNHIPHDFGKTYDSCLSQIVYTSLHPLIKEVPVPGILISTLKNLEMYSKTN